VGGKEGDPKCILYKIPKLYGSKVQAENADSHLIFVKFNSDAEKYLWVNLNLKTAKVGDLVEAISLKLVSLGVSKEEASVEEIKSNLIYGTDSLDQATNSSLVSSVIGTSFNKTVYSANTRFSAPLFNLDTPFPSNTGNSSLNLTKSALKLKL
jgi:hypothetical protein